MPSYLDVHTMDGGVLASDVAGAHPADLQTQTEYGVAQKRYWVDEKAGKIFCLVDAPDAATAARVHPEAHGLAADEVSEGSQHLSQPRTTASPPWHGPRGTLPRLYA